MWIKPIRLEFSEHELRSLRNCVNEMLVTHEKHLRKFKPETAIYAGAKLVCVDLAKLKTKIVRALGDVQ
jgi:hypothetical protein